jgi:hypothetical protein
MQMINDATKAIINSNLFVMQQEKQQEDLANEL